MMNWKRPPMLQRLFVYLAVTLAAMLAVGQPGYVVHAKAIKKKPRPAAAPAASAPSQTSAAPEAVGRWETDANGQPRVRPWDLTPIHINLLPDGRVLFWSRDRYCPHYHDVQGFTRAMVWNPEYNSFKRVNLFPATEANGLPFQEPPSDCPPFPPGPVPTPTPFPSPAPGATNIFCSGHSFLPDGRLFVTGGHDINPNNREEEGIGSHHTNIFDYRNDTWSRGPDMLVDGLPRGRWYPFNVTLANGETLVVSGAYKNSSGQSKQNDVAQIFDLQGQWRDFSGPQLSVHSGPLLSNYPFLHLLHDGRVLAIGKSTLFADLLTPSPVNRQGTWQNGPASWYHHLNVMGGSSVQYAPGKVLLVGGPGAQLPNNTSTKEAEVYDFTDPSVPSRWRVVASMNYPRKYPSTTLLPDGKVLVTGGTSCFGANNLDCGPNGTYAGAVKNPELWNPATETWEVLAAQQEARVYHSVALLLPDARVLVGGGGLPGAEGEYLRSADPVITRINYRKFEHKNVEIFSPPYLFHNGQPAVRPVITHAPKEVAYGQSFQVEVGTVKPSEVAGAVLVRLGSVTHGFNQDQRRVQLSMQASDATNTLTITAPPDGKAAPPGHYMLFLLKSNGSNLTPSVAKIVRIGQLASANVSHAFPASAATRSVAISAPAGTAWTASATGGFITVSPPSGPGPGTLTYSVTANTTASARSGQITVRIEGQPVFDHVIKVYQGKAFTDVPSSNPAYENTGKLNAMGITAGCNDGTTFCPTAGVIRAEMATFLVRSLLGHGVQPPPTTKQTFTDVLPTHWSHLFVEELVRREITKGCNTGSTLFCPNAQVSRGELATFAIRTLGITPRTPAFPTFADVPANHMFYSYIEEAYARGLMPPLQHCPGTGAYGNDGGTEGTKFFSPSCGVTRAEMADLLVRLLKL